MLVDEEVLPVWPGCVVCKGVGERAEEGRGERGSHGFDFTSLLLSRFSQRHMLLLLFFHCYTDITGPLKDS